MRLGLMSSRARDDTLNVIPSAQNSSLEAVRVSEVLAALSFALDLTEGQPMGHSLRSCLIGMEIADRLGLPLHDRRDLYYALLLKDVGCSSNSARVFELFGGDERLTKHDLKRVDWANYFKAMRYMFSHTMPSAPWFQRARRIVSLARAGSAVATDLIERRCERGAAIVTQIGLGARVADGVRSLDEHWDGSGQPRGLMHAAIPLQARILCLAQTLEVFTALEGAGAALEVAEQRSGRWFDPTLVSACRGMQPALASWRDLGEAALRHEVAEREPGGAVLLAGPGTLDRIALGFAEVVDAKSPFPAQHSFRVTHYALEIATRIGFDERERSDLRRAALLHDIGKLSVPNAVLDKPGSLSNEEWEAVRLHPYYTLRILLHVRGFQQIAQVAASHHERLDGRGYFRGLRGEQVPLAAQVIAAADIFEALSSPRPYRPALPEDTALQIMERDRRVGICDACLDALGEVVRGETADDVEHPLPGDDGESGAMADDAERRAA